MAEAVKTETTEDTEPRRVLMRAKSNIGPDDGGFAYALERVEVAPEVEGQRTRWLEALQGTARQLLADAESDAENDDGTSAAGVDGFLRGLLADGRVSAGSIKADADGAGYAWRTVQRAADRIGVDRPKGMHAKTRERLLETIWRCEETRDRAIAKFLAQRGLPL